MAAKTAIQRAKAFEQFDIGWLEESLEPDYYDGCYELSEAVDVHMAACEEENYAYRSSN